MIALVNLLSHVVTLIIYVVIAQAVLSWLMAFHVVNMHNRFVSGVWHVTGRLTEPLLAPIRRFMPDLGGIDLSPIVLILGLIFLRDLAIEILLSGSGRGSIGAYQ